MKAYNSRLNHITEVGSIDYLLNKAHLLQPNSSPKFYYTELIDNVTILEDTGVTLNGEDIFVGDTVYDEKNNEYKVGKVPGGYYPFMQPVKNNFKKVK